MSSSQDNQEAIKVISRMSREIGLSLDGAKVRRTSSRFCLGVEHGDYNGTELFGVGVDRYVWLAFRPNGTGRMRLFSANFPDEGVIDFEIGRVPQPRSGSLPCTWARFPFGVTCILKKNSFNLTRGIDAVVYGNIPGGGMSRSASLTLNLILSLLDANGINITDRFKVVDMAQAVENEYIGSPCGNLDQVMILFARKGMGVHYRPAAREVEYVPLPENAPDFRLVVLDTGTVRPGLEKSTYVIRRSECERLVSLLKKAGFEISSLAQVDNKMYRRIIDQHSYIEPNLLKRLKYIHEAAERFPAMLEAWRRGDIRKVGKLFRRDGTGLRDDYQVSGPEFDSMCDIVRAIPGVLGERMLGGGDKGAAGAIVMADAIDKVKKAVAQKYARAHPEYADKYAVYGLNIVDGVKVFDGCF